MASAITWFEIPARDLARAQKFYEAVLGRPLLAMEHPGRKMAAFPADWTKGEVAGCIAEGEGMAPGPNGTVVFLNCGPDLAPALARVAPAGGQLVLPKTQIPMQDAGFMALIIDSEGNQVGLHSPG